MGVHTVFRKQGKLRCLSAAWVVCQFWPQGKWECDDDGPQTAEGGSQTQRLRGRPKKDPESKMPNFVDLNC